jgi:hypothetical protein
MARNLWSLGKTLVGRVARGRLEMQEVQVSRSVVE